ncbi:spherulation-specific family 4 protein [Streptomyces sp. NPDC054933]
MAPGAGGRLLVPLYIHPSTDPAAWQAVIRHPERVYGVVLNVADGPGTAPEPAFTEVAARLRAAGVRVLGYVDIGYGRRPARDIVRDMLRHRAWYRVDGVFLDQAPSGAALVPRCRRLTRAARRLGARCTVLNHGVCPHPGYARIADVLVTFEGTWSSYCRDAAPGWPSRHRPERFCHLVYGVPADAHERVALMARERGAGVHCAVSHSGMNPWRSAPAVLTQRQESGA